MNLNDKILKSVAFLGTKESGRFSPRATCFFVSWVEDGYRFEHLVTAEHVVSGLMRRKQEIWLRANLIDGPVCETQLPEDKFKFHPNNAQEATDVAICPFSTTFVDDVTSKKIKLDIDSLMLNTGDQRSFLPTEEFKQGAVGLGATIAIVGLFRSHFGENRNIPIVRVGNISAKPGEPVRTQNGAYVKAYLVEARSISGLSGSPVFGIPDSAVMLAKGLQSRAYLQNYQGAALLGLVHGHFDVPNLNEDVVADTDGPERSVHTGIGVVIPVDKIVETINHQDLVAMRQEFAARWHAQGIAAPFPTTKAQQ